MACHLDFVPDSDSAPQSNIKSILETSKNLGFNSLFLKIGGHDRANFSWENINDWKSGSKTVESRIPSIGILPSGIKQKEWENHIIAQSSPWIDVENVHPGISDISRFCLLDELSYAIYLGVTRFSVPLPPNIKRVTRDMKWVNVLNKLAESERIWSHDELLIVPIELNLSHCFDEFIELYHSLMDSFSPKRRVCVQLCIQGSFGVKSHAEVMYKITKLLSCKISSVKLSPEMLCVNGNVSLEDNVKLLVQKLMAYCSSHIAISGSNQQILIKMRPYFDGLWKQRLKYLRNPSLMSFIREKKPQILDRVEFCYEQLELFDCERTMAENMTKYQSWGTHFHESKYCMKRVLIDAIHSSLILLSNRLLRRQTKTKLKACIINIGIFDASNSKLTDCFVKAVNKLLRVVREVPKMHLYLVEENEYARVGLDLSWRNALKQLKVKSGDEIALTIISNSREWRLTNCQGELHLALSDALTNFGDEYMFPEKVYSCPAISKSTLVIPKRVCNYIAPMSSSTTYDRIFDRVYDIHDIPRGQNFMCRDVNKLTDMDIMVRMQPSNCTLIDEPKLVFTWNSNGTKPDFMVSNHEDKTIYERNIEFIACRKSRLVAFIGSVHARLDVNSAHCDLSTTDGFYTSGFGSLMPMLFPMRKALVVEEGERFELLIRRIVTLNKMWYEWQIVGRTPLQNEHGHRMALKL